MAKQLFSIDNQREASGHDLYRSLELLATLRSFERLIDAAENVVIAYGMGWDMDGVIAALAAATPKREGRSG